MEMIKTVWKLLFIALNCKILVNVCVHETVFEFGKLSGHLYFLSLLQTSRSERWAQQVKALAINLKDPSLIPRTHMIEGD